MSFVANALRFLVAELGALAAFAWWGFARGGAGGVALGIAVPAAVVAVWGAFVAPRARRRLRDPARFALEVVIFAAATAALVAVEQVVLGVVYAVVAVATAALVRVWPEPAGPR